jgi:hypothetical protein
MIRLSRQQDLRAVQTLPFCYSCGKPFAADDVRDSDHIPAKALFAKADRDPLIMPSHVACNRAHTKEDEKIGQLVSLIHGRVPSNPGNRRLRIVKSNVAGMGGIDNLDIHAEIWRWVSGFHAALYREPFKSERRSIISPFPKANLVNGKYVFEPILPQHFLFVERIKTSRALKNVDAIVCNKGRLKYECVWGQSDHAGPWLCFFALDIYGWKDLGSTPMAPARGCSGSYVTTTGAAPLGAAIVRESPFILPNHDPLDPFAA